MYISSAVPFVMRVAAVDLPTGDDGTKKTLRAMKAMINAYSETPLIRHLAVSLIRNVKPRDYTGEARKIFKYVKNKIRFVKDTLSAEALQTPDVTLKLGAGDCDCITTLLGSMLRSIGHEIRLVAIGVKSPAFEHVFLEDKVKGKWFPMDASGKNYPFGWKFPEPQRVIYMGV